MLPFSWRPSAPILWDEGSFILSESLKLSLQIVLLKLRASLWEGAILIHSVPLPHPSLGLPRLFPPSTHLPSDQWQVHCLLLKRSPLPAPPPAFRPVVLRLCLSPLGAPLCHLSPAAAALTPPPPRSLPFLQGTGSYTSRRFPPLCPQRTVATVCCDIPWPQFPHRKERRVLERA